MPATVPVISWSRSRSARTAASTSWTRSLSSSTVWVLSPIERRSSAMAMLQSITAPARSPATATTAAEGLLAVRVEHQVVEVQQDRGQRQTRPRPDGDAGQVEHRVGDQQVDREQGEAPRDEDLGRRPQGVCPDGQDVANAGDDEAQGEPGGDGVEPQVHPVGQDHDQQQDARERHVDDHHPAGPELDGVRARQPEALERDPLDADGGEATGEPGGLGAARRSASGSR